MTITYYIYFIDYFLVIADPGDWLEASVTDEWRHFHGRLFTLPLSSCARLLLGRDFLFLVYKDDQL